MNSVQQAYKDALEREDYEEAERLLKEAMRIGAETAIRETGSPLGQTGVCEEILGNGFTRVTTLEFDIETQSAVIKTQTIPTRRGELQ